MYIYNTISFERGPPGERGYIYIYIYGCVCLHKTQAHVFPGTRCMAVLQALHCSLPLLPQLNLGICWHEVIEIPEVAALEVAPHGCCDPQRWGIHVHLLIYLELPSARIGLQELVENLQQGTYNWITSCLIVPEEDEHVLLPGHAQHRKLRQPQEDSFLGNVICIEGLIRERNPK